MLSKIYNEMLKTDPPNKKENLELIKRCADGEDSVIWDVVIKNARLVFYVLKQNFSQQINDETFSDGLWGLYLAIKNMKDPDSKNFSFTAYAIKYIFGHIIKGLQSRQTQLSSASRKHVTQTSLDAEYKNGEDGNSKRLEIPTEHDEQPDHIIAERDRSKYLREVSSFLVDNIKLSEGQRRIVDGLMKHEGKGNLVAQEIGVSRQHVSEVKKRVREKMEKLLSQNPKLKSQFYQMIVEYDDATRIQLLGLFN